MNESDIHRQPLLIATWLARDHPQSIHVPMGITGPVAWANLRALKYSSSVSASSAKP